MHDLLLLQRQRHPGPAAGLLSSTEQPQPLLTEPTSAALLLASTKTLLFMPDVECNGLFKFVYLSSCTHVMKIEILLIT